MFVEDEEKTKDVSVSPIKTYTIDLPSRGKHGYPATIEYRDILVKDEKMLALANENNFTDVINKVLKDVIIGSDSWYNRMSIADRDFLLLSIWSMAYNQRRELVVSCNSCGNRDDITVDLSNTSFSEISDDYVENFPLPLNDGTELTLRTITVGDELAAERYTRNTKEDPTFVLLCSAINTIDGKVLPLKQKIAWVEEHVIGKDMANIRAFHTHFKYGLEPHNHICSECGEGVKFDIPIDGSFFLPNREDDFNAILEAFKSRGGNESS